MGRTTERTKGSQAPREFFWDTAVTFVVLLIFSLAVADLVTEYVRGAAIACFTTNFTSIAPEIKSFCAKNVPLGAYFSHLIAFHGIILIAPHFFWLYHSQNSLVYSFDVVTNLTRYEELQKGDHSTINFEIVQQMGKMFSEKGVFHLYIIKLIFQFIWTIAGFCFILAFFHQKFGPLFHCNVLGGEVMCTFDILTFLETLWIVELVFLIIVGVLLIWAIVWCFSVHTTELGSFDIALFSYNYGISSKFYTQKIPSASCCDSILRVLFHISPLLQRLTYGGPHIVTNLDFMVMKLYHTHHSLGSVFKESQILLHYYKMCADERRRLYIHSKKHRNDLADDKDDHGRIHKTSDMIMDHDELMWKFAKQYQKCGIYTDFEMLPPEYPVVLPGTMRGTVLGFSSRAPCNESAIEVSFGKSIFATSLARVFKWVTALSFNPNVKEISAEMLHPNLQVLTRPENILLEENVTEDQRIWVKPGTDDFHHTGFIVVGPIPKGRPMHMTTVDYLLETMGSCLCKGAVLLTVRPLQISNQDVSNLFNAYQPPKSRFEPLEQTYDVIHKVLEWTARKSAPLISSYNIQSPGRNQSLFRLHIASGNISCIIEFITYQYNNNPDQMPPEPAILPQGTPTKSQDLKDEATALTHSRQEKTHETSI